MANKGICKKCELMFTWSGEIPLKQTRCPVHSTSLKPAIGIDKFPIQFATASLISVDGRFVRKYGPAAPLQGHEAEIEGIKKGFPGPTGKPLKEIS